ncbi:MAG: hypothetical protein ACHQ53_14485 [Polyangiales bacterium]
MKRTLWLLLAAFVAVWGVTWLDLGKPARGGQGNAADSPAAGATVPPPTPADGSGKPVARFRATGGQAEQSAGAKRDLTTSASCAARASQGSVAVVGKHAAGAKKAAASGASPADGTEQDGVQAPASGELGEGILSPDFVELERQYSDEPRDGEWALAEEQRVRELLRDQPLAKDVVLVHCQQTVCRMVLESDSPDIFKQLIDVPGLREETSLGPQTPYSLQSGQLAVYFRKPEATAQAAPR